MGFDSNGTYTRWEGPDTWQKDAAAGTKILANRHDYHDADIGSALSDCLNRTGKGAAKANISMGGFKITNLLKPTALTDAANWDSVTNIQGWTNSKYISGADLNGRLNFTAVSGTNGITWTYVDLSFVGRHSKTNETRNRLVVNNSKAPSTTTNAGDVLFIDEGGILNNSGYITYNTSLDNSGNWRTISAGFATRLQFTDGDFTLASNDVASITNPYVAVTMRSFFTAKNTNGVSEVLLTKSASGKSNRLWGMTASEARWRMDLGDATPETSGRTGSDFVIYAYDNGGLNPIEALRLNRGTGSATLNGDVNVTGSVTATGSLVTEAYLYSDTVNLILQAESNGQVIVRPDGADTNHQAVFSSSGSLSLCAGVDAAAGGLLGGAGLRAKLGSGGAYGTWWINFNWTGAALQVYTSTGLLGNITGSWCDYRIKKDIAPLPSVWDKVKALKPIRYTQAAFQMFDDGDDEQWGFLAHEVQDSLGSTLATGTRDGPDVQGLNLLGVIAGLTKALQEAMTRIEALEAAT